MGCCGSTPRTTLILGLLSFSELFISHVLERRYNVLSFSFSFCMKKKNKKDPGPPAAAAEPEAEAKQESPPPAQEQAPPPEPAQEEITYYEFPHDPPGCSAQYGDYTEREGGAWYDHYAQDTWNKYFGKNYGMEKHYGLESASD